MSFVKSMAIDLSWTGLVYESLFFFYFFIFYYFFIYYFFFFLGWLWTKLLCIFWHRDAFKKKINSIQFNIKIKLFKWNWKWFRRILQRILQTYHFRFYKMTLNFDKMWLRFFVLMSQLLLMKTFNNKQAIIN